MFDFLLGTLDFFADWKSGTGLGGREGGMIERHVGRCRRLEAVGE